MEKSEKSENEKKAIHNSGDDSIIFGKKAFEIEIRLAERKTDIRLWLG
jgi:hypothetical protein